MLTTSSPREIESGSDFVSDRNNIGNHDRGKEERRKSSPHISDISEHSHGNEVTDETTIRSHGNEETDEPTIRSHGNEETDKTPPPSSVHQKPHVYNTSRYINAHLQHRQQTQDIMFSGILQHNEKLLNTDPTMFEQSVEITYEHLQDIAILTKVRQLANAKDEGIRKLLNSLKKLRKSSDEKEVSLSSDEFLSPDITTAIFCETFRLNSKFTRIAKPNVMMFMLNHVDSVRERLKAKWCYRRITYRAKWGNCVNTYRVTCGDGSNPIHINRFYSYDAVMSATQYNYHIFHPTQNELHDIRNTPMLKLGDHTLFGMTTWITFLEYQFKLSKKGKKGKDGFVRVFFFIATSEMFHDALYFAYGVTFTNIYPDDIRMFLALPVRVGGFFDLIDRKHRAVLRAIETLNRNILETPLFSGNGPIVRT